ncbi:uncharacterized protein BT62DRAFT_935034 [Guyanagaster necrorhizus]|uniref:DUF6534 domain-containing protein n=1 Tax=Guyanagaster necrorhizus TaxID=856835 RepID=A0A9P8APJ9_9AGAR|nr:uncharacterized protein BT62DRAFT_935034 [Guyanagaster necrorhizus MCA 3950]KAG7443418.1 hypothetical protein BT62DRAFT_935034 [Guyanagaster necrorhizus MCA 3950]
MSTDSLTQMSSLTPVLSTPLRLDFGATLGAVYIGTTIAAIFYGITILQIAIYYKINPNDPCIFRYTVAILWIFDTLHVALSTHALYFYLIESFGNYLTIFGRIVWSFPLQLLLNMMIIPGVQALYAVRIWKLGRHFHVVLPHFIFVAVAATFGAGIWIMYDTYKLKSFLDIATIRVSIYMNFSTISAADFIIAGAMCFYLQKGRSMTSFSSTAKLILRLMRLVVISGVATSLCSLFTLIAYVAWPNTLVFVAINFILPRLYINSLLAMLNSRKSSMWSVAKERSVDHEVNNSALPVAVSGSADSGQTDITIPSLFVTEVETKITVPLSVTEESRSGGEDDMSFVRIIPSGVETREITSRIRY